jgi:hypothetical protein
VDGTQACVAVVKTWLPLRKTVLRTSAAVAVLTVLGLAVVLLFSDFLINRYLRPRWLRAFAAAHPGQSLRVARMEYRFFQNLTLCRDLSLTSSNAAWSCQVRALALTGVPWVNFLLGERRPSRMLTESMVQADHVTFEFSKAQYQLRFRQLRGSVPERQILADDLDLGPTVSDQEFFAAREYRRPRLRLRAPRLVVSGLETPDLLEGRSYRMRSVELKSPALEVLLNWDKPRNPSRALMPHEALAAIKQIFQINALEIEEGSIKLAATLGTTAEPGVLTFDALRLSAKAIGNQFASNAPVSIRGQARLMNSGLLQGTMDLPLAGPDLSFRYAASLSAMDLRALNSWLQVVGRSRINSGALQSASCDIAVSAGHARGRVEGVYRDLEMTVVDRETGNDAGVLNRLKTAFVNHIALRTSNPAEKSGALKIGAVDYTHKPEDRFLPFLWLGIRSGMLDVLGLSPYVRAPR